jgi:hypothetical protein
MASIQSSRFRKGKKINVHPEPARIGRQKASFVPVTHSTKLLELILGKSNAALGILLHFEFPLLPQMPIVSIATTMLQDLLCSSAGPPV